MGQMEQLENQYSYIFNDLPGTLENSKLLIEMLDYDVIFIPINKESHPLHEDRTVTSHNSYPKSKKP